MWRILRFLNLGSLRVYGDYRFKEHPLALVYPRGSLLQHAVDAKVCQLATGMEAITIAVSSALWVTSMAMLSAFSPASCMMQLYHSVYLVTISSVMAVVTGISPSPSWIQVERLFESIDLPWLELPVSVGQVRPRG